MSYYIHPTPTKQEWLEKHGEVFDTDAQEFIDGDERTVVLVNNNLYFMAAICFDKAEFDDWNDPKDIRPKRWYKVPLEDLHDIAPDFPLEPAKRRSPPNYCGTGVPLPLPSKL